MRRAAVLAVLGASLACVAPAGAVDLRDDPCFRDRELAVGPTGGAAYATVSPFEHFTYDRTQVFPHTCSLPELAGTGTPRILTRSSPADFTTPYIAATRERDELFVYGYGPDAARDGAYVASVDPRTLEQRWRTAIRDATPAGQWSYPGVLLVHGNGDLYAVYGNVLVRLDPETGEIKARLELPEDPGGTGAAYNGMVVLPNGDLVTKKIERGPCPTQAGSPVVAPAGAIAGLQCAVTNALPSLLVVVSPGLRVRSTLVPPEPITGRITAVHLDGRDHVYAAGRDVLRRFSVDRGRLALDPAWGPVTYRTGAQEPGTGPGVLGRWLVVQTNFVASPEPLTLTAVDLRDDARVFRIQPFKGHGAPGSLIVSKAALDAATGMVITHDTAAGQMAGIHLDDRKGFEVRWRRPLTSFAFSALVGPPERREVVIPDFRGTEQVVWLDEATGAERARTGALGATPAPGNIVTPGFGGRFWFTTSQGKLWELRPDTAHRDAKPPAVRVLGLRRGVVRVRVDEPVMLEVRAARRTVRRRTPAGTVRIRVAPARVRRVVVRVLARDAAGNPATVRRVVTAVPRAGA